MLTKNDLYDISFVLILIRSDIEKPYNIEVLQRILYVVQDDISLEDNQIRKAISKVTAIEKDKWGFVFCNNTYVFHQIIRDKEVKELLVSVISDILKCLAEKQYEKAWDLVDTIHFLPQILADNNMRIPPTFWKATTRKYRKKWEPGFLRREQKIYTKKWYFLR